MLTGQNRVGGKIRRQKYKGRREGGRKEGRQANVLKKQEKTIKDQVRFDSTHL